MLTDVVRYTGQTLRIAAVVAAFLVVPLLVWWIAAPSISANQMSDSIRWMLTMSVTFTLALGGACGFLVLKAMANEP